MVEPLSAWHTQQCSALSLKLSRPTLPNESAWHKGNGRKGKKYLWSPPPGGATVYTNHCTKHTAKPARQTFHVEKRTNLKGFSFFAQTTMRHLHNQHCNKTKRRTSEVFLDIHYNLC